MALIRGVKGIVATRNAFIRDGRKGRGINLLVAGLLGVFVSSSYLSIIKRTSSNDLEKELERELLEEFKKQEKQR